VALTERADGSGGTVYTEAAEIIREIFNQYIEGYGMTIIARRLNERGIKSPEFYMRRRIADWKLNIHILESWSRRSMFTKMKIRCLCQ
jgi:hypothetical protein